jgi:GMP synthase (glutamine-hydrolysing)
MSHSDSVKALPTNGVTASTHDVEFAAYKIEGETTYAIQWFSLYRRVKMLENFCVKRLKFYINAFVEDMVAEQREIADDM